MTEYRIAYWKDIPSTVEAGEGDAVVRIPLGARFQELINVVAMQQGLTNTDDYLAQWEKRSAGTRPGGPREVAEEVAAELEGQFEQIRVRCG